MMGRRDDCLFDLPPIDFVTGNQVRGRPPSGESRVEREQDEERQQGCRDQAADNDRRQRLLL
jgi:hypothetical protein